MFTNGQKTRVDGFLSSTSGRASVVSAATATATGINTNPTCGPKADFWHTSASRVICVGSSITYQDLSYNGVVTNRTWTFGGGTPSVSTFENPFLDEKEETAPSNSISIPRDEEPAQDPLPQIDKNIYLPKKKV